MKRLIISLLSAATLAAWGCAPDGLSASLQVSSAPPPPELHFRQEPRFEYLSDLRVSVIADDDFGYDMFGCDGYYYLLSGDYWYRSESVQGPFLAIEASRVPRRVLEVDDNRYHWRNHPQGWRGGHRHGRGHDDDDDHRGGPALQS